MLFVAVVTVYSILLGRNRIVGILVNLYISLAVVLVTGEISYNFISNFSLISSRFAVTEFAVYTILFVLVAGLLSIKSEIAGLDSGGTVPKLQAGIYGFLTAGFILSTTFSFMADSQLTSLDSNFVNLIAGTHVIWIAAPVLFMIGTAFIKKA